MSKSHGVLRRFVWGLYRTEWNSFNSAAKRWQMRELCCTPAGRLNTCCYIRLGWIYWLSCSILNGRKRDQALTVKLWGWGSISNVNFIYQPVQSSEIWSYRVGICLLSAVYALSCLLLTERDVYFSSEERKKENRTIY